MPEPDQPTLVADPASLAEKAAAVARELTRPRFHTVCGQTHVPGPCPSAAPLDEYRGPSCVRCGRPTTWREGQGFLHSKDPSGPLVYYPHQDPFGHEAVSCWEWDAPHERHALTTLVDCPGKPAKASGDGGQP